MTNEEFEERSEILLDDITRGLSHKDDVRELISDLIGEDERAISYSDDEHPITTRNEFRAELRKIAGIK
jgi:hypothetical protein